MPTDDPKADPFANLPRRSFYRDAEAKPAPARKPAAKTIAGLKQSIAPKPKRKPPAKKRKAKKGKSK